MFAVCTVHVVVKTNKVFVNGQELKNVTIVLFLCGVFNLFVKKPLNDIHCLQLNITAEVKPIQAPCMCVVNFILRF